MKIIIDIDTDNAAFGDNDGELLRILNNVSQRVALGNLGGAIRDSNGNTVGQFTVTEVREK